MGKAQSKQHEECESEELREAKRLMEEKGIVGVQASIREKLEGWKDVEIKFCVTGNSGVGKSSFINAFRGIDDEDDAAAEINVVEATSKPTCYTYRDNPNITLTVLPGIGTPTYPNLQVYCEKCYLERYDTFFILTATRFTQSDLELAKEIKSMGKSFFLIRTKIDVDEDNEKRKKKPNIEEMLRKIRANCYENVKDLGISKDEIFLISKHHTDKWDFGSLVEAVLKKLSTHQKEALILSLSLKQLSLRSKAKSKHESIDSEEFQEVARQFEEKGVVGIQDMMKEILEEWRNVEIKIGVTGNAGVGKSSFINAIRGIDDEGESSATTDVVEATSEPARYTYPDNPKITLVDLPGIGTATYRNLEVYCDKVSLETCDTFLILTAERFTQFELELAQKIKSMGKSFFLIRTKMDLAEMNDKRKRSHNLGKMLRKIRTYCHESVKDLEIREDEIFLISNVEKDKWDFKRLVQVILEKLPTDQKKALTLSLKILSKDIVKRKVEILRSQLWRITIIFIATWTIDVATLPIDMICMWVRGVREVFEVLSKSKPVVSEEDFDQLEKVRPIGLASTCFALALLGRKAIFFRSQLGLPEEDSDEFKMMKPEFQNRMRKFYPKEDKGFLNRCVEKFTKPIGPGSKHSKPAMQIAVNSLHQLLDEMEQLSIDILEKAATGDAEQSEQ